MNENDDVLECPFCGSQPGPLATEEDGSLVCDVCLARGPKRKFEWMHGQDGLLGRWNIRHSGADRRKVIEECIAVVRSCLGGKGMLITDALVAAQSIEDRLRALADARRETESDGGG